MARKLQRTAAISLTHAKAFDSKSEPGTRHHAVIHVSAHCSCKSFQARQYCWHTTATMRELGRAMSETEL
jgi:hypothetical protein